MGFDALGARIAVTAMETGPMQMLRTTIAILTTALVAGAAIGIGAATAEPGPDPAVTEMTIRDMQKGRSDRHDFEVVCVVSNVGSAPFVSSKRGQGIALFELKHGESEGHRLRYRRFADLDVGEKLVISNWVKEWPQDKDFPSSFECRLVYDVEKRADQDARNDDENLTNNRQIIRGITILESFSQAPQETPPVPAAQTQ